MLTSQPVTAAVSLEVLPAFASCILKLFLASERLALLCSVGARFLFTRKDQSSSLVIPLVLKITLSVITTATPVCWLVAAWCISFHLSLCVCVVKVSFLWAAASWTCFPFISFDNLWFVSGGLDHLQWSPRRLRFDLSF